MPRAAAATAAVWAIEGMMEGGKKMGGRKKMGGKSDRLGHH